MISEAHHYTLFLKFARQYGQNEKEVNQKWEALLEYEAELMSQLEKKNHTRLGFLACFLWLYWISHRRSLPSSIPP